ncbi:hypothetical protein BY458DRAFT_475387 [Sporodiniella umbellata]|nr:hypothetical protein BY458DRAFT_475387 [Sporodiniella umbellata]
MLVYDVSFKVTATRVYWDAPCIPPLFVHMSRPLKRARSTESLEIALKRSKPFELEKENLTMYRTENIIYPVIKTISISTKTPPSEYSNVNQLLHAIHVKRFGDPEARESWWEERDVEMEDVNEIYTLPNTILKQAFLERHLHK